MIISGGKEFKKRGYRSKTSVNCDTNKTVKEVVKKIKVKVLALAHTERMDGQRMFKSSCK